jgi:hypothetical protein
LGRRTLESVCELEWTPQKACLSAPSVTAAERVSVAFVPVSSLSYHLLIAPAPHLHLRKYVEKHLLQGRFSPLWTGQRESVDHLTGRSHLASPFVPNSHPHVRGCGRRSNSWFLWCRVTHRRLPAEVARVPAETSAFPSYYRSPIYPWLAA